MDWFILALAIIFVLYVGAKEYWEGGTILCTLIIIGIGWSMWHWRDTPEESAAKEARERAARLVRETPHVIREAGGCQVYAFERSGREHYFTRCPETTSTETNWTESCGKNCRSHKQDTIVTPNKK